MGADDMSCMLKINDTDMTVRKYLVIRYYFKVNKFLAAEVFQCEAST